VGTISNTILGTLMSSLGANIVLIALPTIARDLLGAFLFDLRRFHSHGVLPVDRVLLVAIVP
jgi:hypothetical protein